MRTTTRMRRSIGALGLAVWLLPMAASAQTTSGDAALGQTLYATTYNCDSCHGATPGSSYAPIRNAANAGGIINLAMTNGMGGYSASSLTATQENNIAAYIASAAVADPNPAAKAITHNSAGTAFTLPNIYLNSSYGTFTQILTVSAPSKGSVSYAGKVATYTPNTGACGTDSFTWRANGVQSATNYYSNTRQVTLDIGDAPLPVISSAVSKSATVGVATSYTITTTGGTPLSYGAVTLPAGVTRSNAVLSGTPTTAGTVNTTVYAYNCFNGSNTGQNDNQVVTWTIAKGNQSITFPAQAVQTYPVASFVLSPVASSNSGLAISYSSLTTGVCTIAGTTVTRVTAGTCTIAANQAGNANWNVATQVTRNITINKANQTVTFGAQTTPRAYVFNGTFAISPVASATSGLAVTYDSNTPTVCSVAGTTVTMLSAGTCTIGANQAGNVNYNVATEATQNVVINGIAPQPPTGLMATGANTQAVINFTPPANTGGLQILDYTATCTGPNTRTVTGASSPLTVLSMSNGSPYTCSVTSRNSAGSSGASSTVMVTPTSAPTFTSAASTTFTVLGANTFNVTATGNPTPTIVLASGSLPTGVTFSSGSGTGVLSGTPAAGTVMGAPYTVTFNANNGTSINQTFNLTVQKANQSINFSAPANRPMSPTPFTISATATSGLTVTFSNVTPSVCTVSGTSVTMLSVGLCTIAADQTGNANYNPASTVQKSFTISQGTQTITFGAQASRTYAPSGVFMLSPVASASSGLSITYDSLTLAVCTNSGTAVTIITAGTCTIAASQDGNANYAAAVDVNQDIVINKANQIISWGAQTSPRSYSPSGTFAISPLATGGGSSNSVVYTSLTPSVCTVSSITVTMVAAGTCTLAANQASDGNYNAAAQVTRNITINATVPGAPVATNAVASDAQITIDFDPPTNDGGSPITSYTAACGPNGNVVNGAGTPLIVTGLTNGSTYDCAVYANNAAGQSANSNFLLGLTPFLETGANTWTNVCSGCHGAQPAGVRFNAAGTTGTVIAYARSVQPLMQATAAVQALTLNELAEVAKYIETFVPAISANTAFNTPVNVDVSPHLTLGTVSFESAQVVNIPTNGTLGAFSGTQIQYTPNAGFVGVDTFTYRGFRTGTPNLLGDAHTVSVTVAPPPVPVITSATTFNATFNTLATYQITATNSPTSYGATGLGAGCSINTMSGLITCTPSVTGTFMVTVTATNPGGTGMQTVTVTVSKANQTITFGAQAGQTYGLNGTFAISPVATASSSLPVTHSSLTPGVCTVSGTTVTMVSGGTCTLAADQAGNANFNAALQVTQNVAIAATAPGQPTSLVATPGPLSASIAFTAPASNGGSPITGYTASCTPSAMGGAASSPINLTMLSNGVTYTCTVSAINAIGSTASMSVMVTPTAALSSPAFTSNSSVTFNVLAASTFSVTASGNPAPTLSVNTPPPSGLSFVPGTGVLSGTPATGTAGDYSLTFTAMNSQGSVMQTLMLKIAQLSQTITFNNPGTQSFTASTIPLTASSTSGLTVAFASNSPTVCTVSGTNLTLVTTGVCSITASQAGNADYTGATDVTRAFSVNAANQTITFNTQSPSSRSFLAGSTFSINPQASASSGLTVLYSSTTTGICTVAGTTVTMVAPGTCTIAANQGGNANYNMAAQVTQNVSLNATAPGAPTIGIATGGNGQATIDFTAPTNNGGSAITGYVATCNPGGITGNATAAPVVVTGLTNSTQYTCSVAALNAIGTGTSSATVNVTPLSGQGSTIWANVCTACHTTVPGGNQLNAAGTTATVINFVRANQPLMLANSNVQALTNADLIDLATYIETNIADLAPSTAQNTPVNIDVANHITLTGQAWSAFTSVEVVTPPAHGSLGAFGGTGGTVIAYTPNNGYVGSDSFTYRGKRGSTHNGDPRTITITVNPPAPSITSALSTSGTFGALFAYQIDATNTPTVYGASGLPGGLSVNTATGNIFGTPNATGSFVVQVSATNAGGMGTANLMLTINPAPQTITFGAQTSPRTWSAGGTFAISPTATGGASNNAIVYSSNSTGVCTVSGTTVTIVTAGTCIIAADQAGNTNYAAATQATQNVTINAVLPGAPTGLMASAGDTVAAISFTAPSSNGGAPITQYSTSCTPAATFNSATSPINLTGLSNGVPYTCTVAATNSAGAGSASASVMFTPNQTQTPPGFTSANNASVNVTEPLNFQAAASGTPATFTFSLANGSLPSGVGFSASGLLSGTPASGTAGSYPVTLNVSNGVNPSANQSFTLTVNKLSQTITFANPGS